MKISSIAATLALLSGSALANPVPDAGAVEARSGDDNLHQLGARAVTLATKKKRTDKIMYKTTLNYFYYLKRHKNPSWLIWTSDGCTKVPDWPKGFPFIQSCYRHDFGYRNFKKQGRFTKTNKAYIDTQFYKDLLHTCNYVRGGKPCKDLAFLYYLGVKAYNTGVIKYGSGEMPEIDADPNDLPMTEEEIEAERAMQMMEYSEAVAAWEGSKAQLEAEGMWPIPDDYAWPADPEEPPIVPDWVNEYDPEDPDIEPIPITTSTATPTSTTTTKPTTTTTRNTSWTYSPTTTTACPECIIRPTQTAEI